MDIISLKSTGTLDLVFNIRDMVSRGIYDEFPLDPTKDAVEPTNLDYKDVELTEHDDLVKKIKTDGIVWFEHSCHTSKIRPKSIHEEAKKELGVNNDLKSAIKRIYSLVFEQEIKVALVLLARWLTDLIMHIISECGHDKTYLIRSLPAKPKTPIDEDSLQIENLAVLHGNGFYVTLTKTTQYWDTTIEAEILCSITIAPHSI